MAILGNKDFDWEASLGLSQKKNDFPMKNIGIHQYKEKIGFKQRKKRSGQRTMETDDKNLWGSPAKKRGYWAAAFER